LVIAAQGDRQAVGLQRFHFAKVRGDISGKVAQFGERPLPQDFRI
jgi:hypothetical protein